LSPHLYRRTRQYLNIQYRTPLAMAKPSNEASNAIIYTTFAVFLIIGTLFAWRLRNQPKGDFLSGNRTQTGLDDCITTTSRFLMFETTDETFAGFPLALNFIASGELTMR
jgi:hypothetical protein